MTHVKLDLDAIGHGHLTLDGVEPRGIRATTIRAEVGEVTTIDLEHVAVEIDGEVTGEVERSLYVSPIGFGRGPTLRDALLDLVRQIDEAANAQRPAKDEDE